MKKTKLFNNYENARLLSVEEYRSEHPNSTVAFDSLGEKDIAGIPISITRNEKGTLDVTFAHDSHMLAIGATRSGKTTGFVIPTINVLMRKKNKPSLVISDPKQELYSSCAKGFKKNGYRIIQIDFTDYIRSDCWNPLTKCFRTYKKYLDAEKLIRELNSDTTVKSAEKSKALRDAEEEKVNSYDEAEKNITALCCRILPTVNQREPYWEDSARDLLKAIIYGMLEDIGDGSVTEDNFSISNIIKIYDEFPNLDTNVDGGYFNNRNHDTSKAYQLARNSYIGLPKTTRQCVVSTLGPILSRYRDTAVRKATCTNTFEMSDLDNGEPTVIFISYKDEESLHYEVISMFLSSLYTELIATARKKGTKLDRPFYFLLDEFGNLPKFADFDKVISACGGRSIWFMLILQSYAQLNNVYGKDTAEIIKDNLNMHIFFGTNNPQTKIDFSEECGKQTVLSPSSALNGKGEAIERYDINTVALVPISKLNEIKPGDCIVTQMKEDVLWGKFERSYTCKEFKNEKADSSKRQAKVDFLDPKYVYARKQITEKKTKNDFTFDF